MLNQNHAAEIWERDYQQRHKYKKIEIKDWKTFVRAEFQKEKAVYQS